jgi:hypothetical protein
MQDCATPSYLSNYATSKQIKLFELYGYADIKQNLVACGCRNCQITQPIENNDGRGVLRSHRQNLSAADCFVVARMALFPLPLTELLAPLNENKGLAAMTRQT